MPKRSDRFTRAVVKAAKKPMDGARSSKADSVLDMEVRHRDFSALEGHAHALLVTYKRDGGAVPTPVWFAQDGGRLYVWTEENSYKVKRLRRNPTALLAPCSPTGAPTGPPIAATGRVLSDEADRAVAARVIKGNWNLGQRIFERVSRPLTDVHYLEFQPAALDSAA